MSDYMGQEGNRSVENGKETKSSKSKVYDLGD